jgi:hypothetical protein
MGEKVSDEKGKDEERLKIRTRWLMSLDWLSSIKEPDLWNIIQWRTLKVFNDRPPPTSPQVAIHQQNF